MKVKYEFADGTESLVDVSGDLMLEFCRMAKVNPEESPETLSINDMEKAAETDVEDLEAMDGLDAEIKEKLSFVFGAWNDFNAIFSGLSIFAINDEGETIIESFVNAITPIIEQTADSRRKTFDSRLKSALKKQK
ncbi:hypothetical protein FACS189490_11860 [Clostridia bacterium]|nr:hypothetical protein FACS189490_11860 [Clostridia bacterium]